MVEAEALGKCRDLVSSKELQTLRKHRSKPGHSFPSKLAVCLFNFLHSFAYLTSETCGGAFIMVPLCGLEFPPRFMHPYPGCGGSSLSAQLSV